MGVRVYEHATGLGQRLQPRRQVGRLAHGRELGSDVVADGREYRRTGTHAHAHREGGDAVREAAPEACSQLVTVGIGCVAQLEGRQHGALRVVLVCRRHTEEREDPVAHQAADCAAVLGDGAVHERERAVHRSGPLLGAERLRQTCRARHVSEENADQLLLAFDRPQLDKPRPAVRAEPGPVGGRLPADRTVHKFPPPSRASGCTAPSTSRRPYRLPPLLPARSVANSQMVGHSQAANANWAHSSRRSLGRLV